MGTGQMLLTVVAIMLLGSVMLTTNRTMNSSNTALMETNCGLAAVSIATSIIQQADALPFDRNTISGVASTTGDLSSTLGPEGNDDSLHTADDFDDFNNMRFTVRDSTGLYGCRTEVHYVGNPSNLMENSSTRQWTKRLDVYVWNTVLPDTVVMHSIYSYWFFGRGGRP